VKRHGLERDRLFHLRKRDRHLLREFLMCAKRRFVVLLEPFLELRIVIDAAVDDRTLVALDDRGDVVTRHRLVRLHRVREREHEDAVLVEQRQ
jgi:hypothetical protein